MNTAAIRRIASCLVAVATLSAGVGTTTRTHAATNPMPDASPQQAVTRIQLSFDRTGYEWWGRPFFMDVPGRTDCYTDVGRRMLMLSVGVRIKNNSRVAMTADSWNIVFTNNRGRRASWCFVLDPAQPLSGDNAKEILPIAPGATVAFAAQVFIEANERVKNAYVVHKTLGRSNTATVPARTKAPDQ